MLSTCKFVSFLFVGIAVANVWAMSPLNSYVDDVSPYMTKAMLPLPASTMTTMRQMLQSKISQRQVSRPAGVVCSTCLFKSWLRRVGTGHGRRFMIGDLNAAMLDYPTQVRDRLKTLLFSSSGSTTFESFSVDVTQTYAVKRSYFGLARRLNDVVEVAIVSADISAELVPKFITLQRRVCKKILWIKKCKTEYFTERRGYYTSEINSMTTALLAETFSVFSEHAARI